MTIEVFPVRLVDAATPIERNRRGHRCPKRIHYTDTHDAARGRLRHEAQDIFGPSGALILAPEGGVIVGSSATSGPTPKGGHFLRLEVRRPSDGAAVRTYYLAHLLDTPHVREGDRVAAGDVVGKLGRTGNAQPTCPHLHIGARRYRRGRALNLFEELVAVDPRRAAGAATATAAELEGTTSETTGPPPPLEEVPTRPEVRVFWCAYSERLCSSEVGVE